MSRQRGLIPGFLVGLVLVSAFIVVSVFVRKRRAKANAADTISKHHVDTPANEALAYWTADKMREAKPAELPNVDILEQGKKQSRHATNEQQP